MREYGIPHYGEIVKQKHVELLVAVDRLAIYGNL